MFAITSAPSWGRFESERGGDSTLLAGTRVEIRCYPATVRILKDRRIENFCAEFTVTTNWIDGITAAPDTAAVSMLLRGHLASVSNLTLTNRANLV